MTVYERIKILREAQDMSQAELARLLGYAGRSAVSKIELGQRDIRQSTLAKIAKILNTTPTFLLLGEDAQEELEISEIEALYEQLSPEQKKMILSAIKGLLSNQ